MNWFLADQILEGSTVAFFSMPESVKSQQLCVKSSSTLLDKGFEDDAFKHDGFFFFFLWLDGLTLNNLKGRVVVRTWISARVNLGSSVIDSKSVNVNIKVLNCSSGPLVVFCKRCPLPGELQISRSCKWEAWEIEVNGRERARALGHSWWYQMAGT